MKSLAKNDLFQTVYGTIVNPKRFAEILNLNDSCTTHMDISAVICGFDRVRIGRGLAAAVPHRPCAWSAGERPGVARTAILGELGAVAARGAQGGGSPRTKHTPWLGMIGRLRASVKLSPALRLGADGCEGLAGKVVAEASAPGSDPVQEVWGPVLSQSLP
jgi:hypothetical protein